MPTLPADGTPLRHLAVIPDGNRRWARARGLGPEDGHRAGIANVGETARAAFASGIETFSFWWGSPANLTKRDAAEVRGIVGVLETWLAEVAPALCAEADARVEVIGRWRELCPSLEPAIEALPTHGTRHLVLFMAYDGREEIRAAAESDMSFEDALWTAHLPPVDLLIRTGGDAHFSAGFLLWKLAQAQLAFPDELWPAYGRACLERDLDTFARTQRRFGR
ncbi:MAG: undecaprenyl diphosphate synthase family protein [Deltaproteobacteria bacterium]|nr:undecaprenyl diphosphate synthase family protein [Deltaproteobacteria bacterium]